MTIMPADLRKILDVLARSNVSLGEAYQLRGTLDTLVALAAGSSPIGAIAVPMTIEPDRV